MGINRTYQTTSVAPKSAVLLRPYSRNPLAFHSEEPPSALPDPGKMCLSTFAYISNHRAYGLGPAISFLESLTTIGVSLAVPGSARDRDILALATPLREQSQRDPLLHFRGYTHRYGCSHRHGRPFARPSAIVVY